MCCHPLSHTSRLFYLRVLECLWTLSRRWVCGSLFQAPSRSCLPVGTCGQRRPPSPCKNAEKHILHTLPTHTHLTDHINKYFKHLNMFVCRSVKCSVVFSAVSLWMKYSLNIAMIKCWEKAGDVSHNLPFTKPMSFSVQSWWTDLNSWLKGSLLDHCFKK